MTRVVSIGECMVELAPQAGADLYRIGFAGDTLNTAWYLRRLLPEAQIDYLTAVGTDAISDQMVAFLQHSGIGTAHVARRAGLTVGLYMIQLSGAERSFAYWRGQSAARTLAADPAALTRALEGADLAYISGITLAILGREDRQTLLTALQDFRAKGGKVAFDPNLRPRLWTSPEEMRQAITDAAACADIVLPSFEDEAQWFGDASPEATARRYAGAGVACVVVKNGGGEMLTLREGAFLPHPCKPVADIVDTTAAGDSFNAGFLAAWLGDAPLAQAVAAGADLAGQVIRQRGALVPVQLPAA